MDRIGTIPKNLHPNSWLKEVRVTRGENIEVLSWTFSRIFRRRKVCFSLEEGGSKVWWPNSSLLPLVGTVPIFCHPGFERCIEFRSCKIHERISWYIVAAIFRTTISQFRRERVRVNARTTRMILGDLRSPNRSQITFALVLMAGVHVSVQLSTRIQFHRVVHSTLYKWNELYPTLIIIVL